MRRTSRATTRARGWAYRTLSGMTLSSPVPSPPLWFTHARAGVVYGLPEKSSEYYYKEALEVDAPLAVCRAVAVRNLTHKLVYRSDPLDADHFSEMYDLVADPLELSNRYGDQSLVRLEAELKEEVLRWLVQTSDITPWSMCDRSSGVCGATPFRRWRQ